MMNSMLHGLVAGLFGLMNIFARTTGGFISDRFVKKSGLRGRVKWLFIALFIEGIARNPCCYWNGHYALVDVSIATRWFYSSPLYCCRVQWSVLAHRRCNLDILVSTLVSYCLAILYIQVNWLCLPCIRHLRSSVGVLPCKLGKGIWYFFRYSHCNVGRWRVCLHIGCE